MAKFLDDHADGDAGHAAAFAVDDAASGRPWRMRPHCSDTALAISQRFALADIVGRVLAGRGIVPETVTGFMTPRLKTCLPDPDHLLGVEAAVARLAGAVEAQERVGIIGDYDVDGATSSALMAGYLRALGIEARVDIPDRIDEGYGPNSRAFARLREQGCRLVLCLDSGTTAHDVLAQASDEGFEVVVVDHHAAEAELPAALAVINPNRQDQNSPCTDLAAVGVTFLLVVALNRTLRARGAFVRRDEPDLLALLDLVALGTVCDVVPLTGLNRAFVVQGLHRAGQGGNLGMRTLAEIAKAGWPPDVGALGFQLGPRINAGGRIGTSDLGVRLLTTTDAGTAQGLALKLDELNRKRRELERATYAQAQELAKPLLDADAPVLAVAQEGWHPGVIGIVASRLVERFNKPAFVIALDGARGKGSGRSVPGFDLGKAVIAARQAGLLLYSGGHAMAAGLTVERARLPAFIDYLCACYDRSLATTPELATPNPVHIDAALSPASVTLDLARCLERLAPFGSGNPEPCFVLPAVQVVEARRVGENHVRCRFADMQGGKLNAIGFRFADQPRGRMLFEHDAQPRHVVGRLKVDRYQGRERASFQIDDVAPG